MRFTIRDLLWLMVVVGMGVGWWVDRGALSDRLARLKADLHFSRAVDGLY
jgi:hypothetical protein